MTDVVSKSPTPPKSPTPEVKPDPVNETVSGLASGEKDPVGVATGFITQKVDKSVQDLLDELPI